MIERNRVIVGMHRYDVASLVHLLLLSRLLLVLERTIPKEGLVASCFPKSWEEYVLVGLAGACLATGCAAADLLFNAWSWLQGDNHHKILPVNSHDSGEPMKCKKPLGADGASCHRKAG